MAVLARVERTDFLSPMCIGEVAHVSAEITYTSKHSVEVQVNVMSEDILTGSVCALTSWAGGSRDDRMVMRQGPLSHSAWGWSCHCPQMSALNSCLPV